jgi:hypothetical protein
MLAIAGTTMPVGAAEIGLIGSALDPVVIVGGSTTLEATVTNTGGAGSGNLNYEIAFYTPGGPSTANDVLAPGGSETWQATYDSTGQPFGENLTGVVVTDPAATNSPHGTEIGVTVLDHSHAYLSKEFGPLMELAQEPSVDFLAFGATGGGETFSAISMAIANDPPHPTAGLDLDYVYADPLGDPQITIDLGVFTNLPFNDDPHFGHQFNVLVDTTQLGTFTRKFYLYFSDQDLPGATAPQSVLGAFTVVATVVPEPATGSLLALGLVVLARCRRRARA